MIGDFRETTNKDNIAEYNIEVRPRIDTSIPMPSELHEKVHSG